VDFGVYKGIVTLDTGPFGGQVEGRKDVTVRK
jgi:hypothetical protein